MFLGKLAVVNLANVAALNLRIHKFWWFIGILFLVIIIVMQRFMFSLWLQRDLDDLQQQLEQERALAKRYQVSLEKIPDSLPQQHQYTNKKLSALLALLQHSMPNDLRLLSIDWFSSLRIEGESKSRESISPLRNRLMASGYFSDITLEQIHYNKLTFNFTLLVKFSDELDFSELTQAQ